MIYDTICCTPLRTVPRVHWFIENSGDISKKKQNTRLPCVIFERKENNTRLTREILGKITLEYQVLYAYRLLPFRT